MSDVTPPVASHSSMFEPTAEQRRMVRVMSGFGIPQQDIATHIGIDPKTLRKHFREELDRGMTEANIKVAQSLFSMATTGGNVAAAIFWMKARAGWREKHEIVIEEKTDLDALTPAQYRAYVLKLHQDATDLVAGLPPLTIDATTSD